jgi:beta-lactamase class A
MKRENRSERLIDGGAGSPPRELLRAHPHSPEAIARRLRPALTACLFLATTAFGAEPPAFQLSPPLQALVDAAARSALEQTPNLRAEQFAITLVDLREPTRPARASVRGDVPIYPASVIKLFYLAAAHRWLEDRKIADTPELRRALKDMIVDSSNDATHYVIDLLTETTSGPELPDDEIKTWFEKRNAVNRYFESLGYTAINANKKPWGDGPYGRETQAIQRFDRKRNMLTTDATARLLVEIATDRCVTPSRCGEMRELLARNHAAPAATANSQAKYIGAALPETAKLWSKAGWTSQTRHDAAIVELPDGRKFALVIFTVDHATNRTLIPAIAKSIIEGLGSR